MLRHEPGVQLRPRLCGVWGTLPAVAHVGLKRVWGARGCRFHRSQRAFCAHTCVRGVAVDLGRKGGVAAGPQILVAKSAEEVGLYRLRS